MLAGPSKGTSRHPAAWRVQYISSNSIQCKCSVLAADNIDYVRSNAGFIIADMVLHRTELSAEKQEHAGQRNTVGKKASPPIPVISIDDNTAMIQPRECQGPGIIFRVYRFSQIWRL